MPPRGLHSCLPSFLLRLALLFTLAAGPAMLAVGPAEGALPEVTLGKVLDAGAGGSFTSAMTAQLDGRKVFVKSVRGNARGTRYANLEADVLASQIFARLGVRCPSARIVRLTAGSTCRDRLGDVVQVMEFVDTRFAGGKVFQGFWPTLELADADTYIKIALVDILVGNADRRDANFFVTVPYAAERPIHTPIPIDNNAGFGTMIPWFIATDQMNFVKSYDGLGRDGTVQQMGTIANIVRQSPLSFPALGHPQLEKRVFQLEKDVRERLDDGWWSIAVALLPAEMIPADLKIDPAHDIPDATALPGGVTRDALFGGLAANLSHARLVAARRTELRDIFAWRRDHLRGALEKYLAWRRADPEQQKLDAEIR